MLTLLTQLVAITLMALGAASPEVGAEPFHFYSYGLARSHGEYRGKGGYKYGKRSASAGQGQGFNNLFPLLAILAPLVTDNVSFDVTFTFNIKIKP